MILNWKGKGGNMKEYFIWRAITTEHYCINTSNLRPTDSIRTAHLVLPKVLSTLEEFHINQAVKYMATLARYLRIFEGKKIQMSMTNKRYKRYLKLQKKI